MKKKTAFIILSMIMLCSCHNGEINTLSTNDSLVLNEQTIEQLQLEDIPSESGYKPINYENQKALWLTVMDLEEILCDKSEEAFTDDISALLEKIKDTGFNTVYVHVRPFNDAYYKSDIFPPSKTNPEEFDPLKIILAKAHKLDLSVHCWINPLRCQTESELKRLDDKYQIKKWYNMENEDYISFYEGRYYLNPAYEEVREYIGNGVEELVRRYDVDGIHIDDYFYPATNKEFDSLSFERSGQSDLKKWRTENINLTVTEIYNTIKQENKDVLFGISPQGNIDINKNNLYADVTKWCSEEGYCDYIVPQLYYGFKNESKPFAETLDIWCGMLSDENKKLGAGICMYKIGSEDKWAGSGKNEWIEDKNIPSRQIEYALENNCNIAVYSVDSLFDEKNSEECQLIQKLLKEKE